MGGTSEAHAAIDADLPPVSLAPWTRLSLVAPTSDSSGPYWPVYVDYQSYGIAATAMRPRAIAAWAIAVHADSVDAPFGRFSEDDSAYTVKR